MIDYELGVIGAGNMAMAILRGVVKSGYLQRDSIVAYDPVFSCQPQRPGAVGMR